MFWKDRVARTGERQRGGRGAGSRERGRRPTLASQCCPHKPSPHPTDSQSGYKEELPHRLWL